MASLNEAFDIPIIHSSHVQRVRDEEDITPTFTWDEMITCIIKQNKLKPDPNLFYDFLNCPINGHAYFVYEPNGQVYTHPVNKNVHKCV